MFLRHLVIYGVGKIIPTGLSMGFLLLVILALPPSEYGQYSATIAGASITITIMFWWLRLGVLRFAADAESWPEVVGSAALVHLALTLGGLFGAAVMAPALTPAGRLILFLGVLLVVTRGTFDLVTEVPRALLYPGVFALVNVVRPAAAIGIFVLPIVPTNYYGAIIGLVVGAFCGIAVATALSLPKAYKWVRARRYRLSEAVRRSWSPSRVQQLMRFGVPVAVVFSAQAVLSGSDRIILVLFGDKLEAGHYGAAFDATLGLIGSASTIVYLAGYPLLMRIAGGRQEGKEQPSAIEAYQLTWHSAVMPVAIFTGLAALLVYKVDAGVLGHWKGALRYIPAAVIVTVLLHYRTHVLDVYYHSKNTVSDLLRAAIWVVAANLVGSLLVVSQFGAYGVATVTVAASLAFVVVTLWHSGWRALHVGGLREMLIPGLAAVATASALGWFVRWNVVSAVLTSFIAAAAYAAAALIYWSRQRREIGAAFDKVGRDE